MSGLRAQRAREVADLRAQGMTQKAIARRLGLSRSYVSDLIRDPEGTDVAERKLRAMGTCADCGGLTTYVYGGSAARCDPCARRARSARAQAENPCGTRAAYVRGCRCADCRSAAAAYVRRRRASAGAAR